MHLALLTCILSAAVVVLGGPHTENAEMKVLGPGGGIPQQQISDNRDGEKHTVCPGKLIPFCCEELDYSGFEVECVGPGKVEYLEMCRDFEPPTMCCCTLEQADSDPGGPPYRFPRHITCDKECHALDLE